MNDTQRVAYRRLFLGLRKTGKQNNERYRFEKRFCKIHLTRYPGGVYYTDYKIPYGGMQKEIANAWNAEQ